MKTGAQQKLLLVKIVHTAIWLLFASLVCYVLWSGIGSGNPGAYAWYAVVAVAGEGLVLMLFGGKCPLTVIARRYSDSEKDNFDIFLPNWLARYNKLIFTTLFLAGLGLMLWKEF